MHYTAMAAVVIIPVDNAGYSGSGINTFVLSLVISIVVFLVLTVALIVPHVLRFREMIQVLHDNEESLKIGEIAFQTHEAILVTNAVGIIVRVNKAFTEITGYSKEEALGNNPNMLSSGRHDEAFYFLLWESLSQQGQWEGEIYNRRKNGELYLQYLTIKVLHNAKGDITNHIAMFTDITEEREHHLQLQHLSEHDVLTELPNRFKLNQEFEFALTSAKRLRNKLAILFFDLNDFKPINDNYGHIYGDMVLQTIADRMAESIRDTDMVARIGGDEFVVLMTNIESDDAMQVLMAKLKAVISEPITVKENTFTVNASGGMAEYPEQGDTLEKLLHVADGEMYKDKAKMNEG